MAKSLFILLSVVACCYAQAENGVFRLSEPGQGVSIPTDSAKPLLKPEDEAELSALEERRDHLMALVEEMETSTPRDERRESSSSRQQRSADAPSSKSKGASAKSSSPDPGKDIPKQVEAETAAGNKAATSSKGSGKGAAAAAAAKAAAAKAKAQGSDKDSAKVTQLRKANEVLRAKLAASEKKIVDEDARVKKVEEDKKTQGLFSMSTDSLRQMNDEMKAQIGIDKNLVKKINPSLLGKMGAKSLQALDESLKGAITGTEAADKKESAAAKPADDKKK